MSGGKPSGRAASPRADIAAGDFVTDDVSAGEAAGYRAAEGLVPDARIGRCHYSLRFMASVQIPSAQPPAASVRAAPIRLIAAVTAARPIILAARRGAAAA